MNLHNNDQDQQQNFCLEKNHARPLNDPRFDSVVVIYVSAKRGLGSGLGFFIKPDVVLNNWHVVKRNKFVEMKMYNGRETFGKVIAKDMRLDIALIKVQSRGRPVHFYAKRNLDLGATQGSITVAFASRALPRKPRIE